MWYAVYTKPRKEESVAFLLRNIGIEALSPKLKLQRYRNNRFTEVIEPLFPCYVFADFEKAKHFHLISYTRGVRYVVGKHDPVVVQDEVISTIKNSMGEGKIIVLSPPKLRTGDRVLIREGPFKDFYGLFERETRAPDRVIILLSTLDCRIELDSHLLAVA